MKFKSTQCCLIATATAAASVGTFVLLASTFRAQHRVCDCDPIIGSEAVYDGGNRKPQQEVPIINETNSNLTRTLEIKSIVNLPGWYRNRQWGLKKNASLESLQVTNKGSDVEEETAWNNFFYGTTNGLMLELGAMDGKQHSVSEFFEVKANWCTILVEGNPILASQLSKNRPNSLNLNVVICETPREVHFTTKGGSGDGIVEFMEDKFLSLAHPELVTNKKINWGKVAASELVRKVQCLPFAHVFDPFQIFHINFFLLDVEGGELNVLKGIDFNRFSFDVILVETDRGTETQANLKIYVDSVVEILVQKGYLLWKRKLGRNTWFISSKFTPFKKQGL